MVDRTSFIHLVQTHLVEWLTLAVIFAVNLVLASFLKPFQRFIDSQQLADLQCPLKPFPIPNEVLPLLIYLLPIAIFLLFYYLRRNKKELHFCVLALLAGVQLSKLTALLSSRGLGFPSPNFSSVCFPDGNPSFSSSGDVSCSSSADPHKLERARESFPNLQTALLSSSLFFLSLHLSHSLHLSKPHPPSSLWAVPLYLLPAFAALILSATYNTSYWASWQDIAAGLAIGGAFSWLSFSLLFQDSSCCSASDSGAPASLTFRRLQSMGALSDLECATSSESGLAGGGDSPGGASTSSVNSRRYGATGAGDGMGQKSQQPGQLLSSSESHTAQSLESPIGDAFSSHIPGMPSGLQPRLNSPRYQQQQQQQKQRLHSRSLHSTAGSTGALTSSGSEGGRSTQRSLSPSPFLGMLCGRPPSPFKDPDYGVPQPQEPEAEEPHPEHEYAHRVV